MPRKLKYSSNIKDNGLLGKEIKVAAELYCKCCLQRKMEDGMQIFYRYRRS